MLGRPVDQVAVSGRSFLPLCCAGVCGPGRSCPATSQLQAYTCSLHKFLFCLNQTNSVPITCNKELQLLMQTPQTYKVSTTEGRLMNLHLWKHPRSLSYIL